MNEADFGERLTAWALAAPEVALLALIGSRCRAAGTLHGADRHSDWDFQIATTAPEQMNDSAWLKRIGLTPLHYVERTGRLGSARKVTALFREGEVDWVVLPLAELRGIAQLAPKQWPAVPAPVARAVADFAAVLQGGYRLLKGAEEFAPFYEFASTRVPQARLNDAAAAAIADSAVCDYVATMRKIRRGELVAAQRWLHVQLTEANLQLLHEVRLRRGAPSLPDGRRLEFSSEPRLEEVGCEARLDVAELEAATEKAAAACRTLMRDLVGERWSWPDLSALRLRAE